MHEQRTRSNRLTLTDLPDFAHLRKPVCKSTARAIMQGFFRAKQICKGCFHEVPLLPSRMRDGQSVMLKVLIVIKDDV